VLSCSVVVCQVVLSVVRWCCVLSCSVVSCQIVLFVDSVCVFLGIDCVFSE